MLPNLEALFPVKKDMIFLAHCAISPLFAGAARAMQRFVGDMAAGGITALPGYFDVMPRFHRNVARFLGTAEHNISYVHNTAEALCMIAGGYPFAPGDEVISYVHEYPSNHYPWVLQQRRGVKLVLLDDVAPCEGCDDIAKPKGWSMAELERKITPRTRVVALSHVQFTSGFAADLQEVGALCRERGVDLIVDCAQSVGSLPVRPEMDGLAAVVASGWKWLMGPKGSALLYTSPALRDKLDHTMAGPGLMRQGLDYLDHRWAPHRDGRMFEYSTLPWDHVAGMNAVLEELFLQLHMDEVRARILHLQDVFLAHVDRGRLRFLELPSPNRSGILVAQAEGDAMKIVSALKKAGLVISAPVGYLRIAPHFYNDEEQMIAAAHALNRVMRER